MSLMHSSNPHCDMGSQAAADSSQYCLQWGQTNAWFGHCWAIHTQRCPLPHQAHKEGDLYGQLSWVPSRCSKDSGQLVPLLQDMASLSIQDPETDVHRHLHQDQLGLQHPHKTCPAMTEHSISEAQLSILLIF